MDDKIINPAPFTVEVMDLEGKNHKLTGRVVPRKQVAEFNRVVFFDAADQTKVNPEDQLAFQASYLYEKPMEFWDNFDIRTVAKVVSLFLADMRNPLQ